MSTQNYIDIAQLESLGTHISSALPEGVISHSVNFGELSLRVDRTHIIEVLRFLRDDSKCLFETLIDIAGADYPAREERFELVYHLLSMKLNLRVRLTLSCDDVDPVESVIPLFPVADWYEREAFDLYGILFANHPDLRRILTDYGFEGHPLRKDFPLTGHTEVRYDPIEKRVVHEAVALTMEYRDFDFESPWEGITNLPSVEK